MVFVITYTVTETETNLTILKIMNSV